MDSHILNDTLHAELPNEIIQIPPINYEESLNYIKHYLEQNLPSSDSKNLNNDVKWKFLLEKHSLEKRKKGGKGKKTFLTRRERIKLNLLKLPKNSWSYEKLLELRNMWKSYMRENFDLITKAPSCTDHDWTNFSSVIAKSELVGAELTVIRSKVPSLIRMTGTVVLETKMTFQIVTPESKLKTIIKDGCVFEFRLDNMKFTVFGKYLTTKPSERSVKKIKSQMVPDL